MKIISNYYLAYKKILRCCTLLNYCKYLTSLAGLLSLHRILIKNGRGTSLDMRTRRVTMQKKNIIYLLYSEERRKNLMKRFFYFIQSHRRKEQKISLNLNKLVFNY